jgi:hypothetical protein
VLQRSNSWRMADQSREEKLKAARETVSSPHVNNTYGIIVQATAEEESRRESWRQEGKGC